MRRYADFGSGRELILLIRPRQALSGEIAAGTRPTPWADTLVSAQAGMTARVGGHA